MRKKCWLYSMIVLVMLLTVGVTAAQDADQVTVIGGDEAGFRQIITYLAKSPLGKDVTVTVGQLPETLPFVLPVADDSVIIGSVRSSRYSSKIEIWLHSPQSMQTVIDFYIEQFTQAGWTIAFGDSDGSKNEDAAATTSNAGFCAEELAVSLELHTLKQEAGDTIIMVDIDQNYAETFCVVNSIDKAQETMVRTLNLLPPFISLPGVTVSRVVRHGSDGVVMPLSVMMSVILETEMSVGEVRSLYDRRLEDAGWHQVAVGSDDSAAWSNWTFQDETGKEWHGVLTLTQIPTVPTEYFALLYIERLENWP